VVPAFGVLGEFGNVILGDVSLDEFDPKLGVVFLEVGGFEFEVTLRKVGI
jgi:hypothetical protein